MNRTCLVMLVVAMSFVLAGCTFARYSKLHMHVVDEQTQAGIPKASVRTFYVKPMLDMTYQRKDREKTDRDGFTTLTVATNSSQRTFLGWTHGIIPWVTVEADGYVPQQVGVPRTTLERSEAFVVKMQRPNNGAAANRR